MSTNNENKQYCIWCGEPGDCRAIFCSKCGKKMDPDENLLIDYLVSRTKSKFKSKAINTVYDALKGYLLSHLYGVTLIISIVAVTAMNFITEVSGVENISYMPEYVTAYIENTNDTPASPIKTPSPSETPRQDIPYQPRPEDEQQRLADVSALIEEYIQLSLFDNNPSERSELHFAGSENYGGHHMLNIEYLESKFDKKVKIDRFSFTSQPYITYTDSKFAPSTKLASRLSNEAGYTVCNASVMVFYAPEGSTIIYTPVFEITAVYDNGQWFIAGETER